MGKRIGKRKHTKVRRQKGGRISGTGHARICESRRSSVALIGILKFSLFSELKCRKLQAVLRK